MKQRARSAGEGKFAFRKSLKYLDQAAANANVSPRLREVAIKVLPEAFARDPKRLARFERE